MLVLPRTVKWRVKGRIFFRRLHGVSKVEVIGDSQGDDISYRITKENGASANIPYDGTEVLFGKRVKAPALEGK